MKKAISILGVILMMSSTFAGCENDSPAKESGSLFNSNPISKQKEKIAEKTIETEGFTIKKNIDLPTWFEQVGRTYMLNDDRIEETELVEYIGGYLPNKGEIFFIDNAEIIFSEKQTKIEKTGTVITKTLVSGKYTIKMYWDTEETTGAYSEGKINLYINNESVFNSSFIISGY